MDEVKKCGKDMLDVTRCVGDGVVRGFRFGMMFLPVIVVMVVINRI